MKLNQDFTMAVETVQFLRERKSENYIRAEDIAETLGFSMGYLQKTVVMLGKHGILEGKRGRIGGVKLRKRKVTLLDLWNATCGEIDNAAPDVPVLKKPLKAFSDAMKEVVICK
jgi:DNA-binding IscR family transcriptional regulator